MLESITSFSSRLLPRCSSKEHFANPDKHNSLYWTQKLYSTELSKQYPIARRSYLVAIAYTFFLNLFLCICLRWFWGKNNKLHLLTCFLPCLIQVSFWSCYWKKSLLNIHKISDNSFPIIKKNNRLTGMKHTSD